MSESLSFLGLAKRAGRLASGEDAVQEAAEAGKIRLLILASDAGDKTVRHTEHQSGGKLPIAYLASDKAALGAALGWGSCAVAAVTDLGMALAYAKKLAEADPRHQPVLDALTETDQRIRARKARKPGKTCR
ncbi:MAG: 50S ribosomal protein L7ae [Clostridiales bacterium]|nr:50S ribosomal protein L7ae [Clostridiales bacterium]